MNDPVQRHTSLLDWIRVNRLEASRRLGIWLLFVGVLLYIFGEILSVDWAVQSGIWLLLAAIVGATIYKFMVVVVDLFKTRS
jgi:hypothetical protein